MKNNKPRKVPPGHPEFCRWAYSQPVKFSFPFESEAGALNDMERLVNQEGRVPGGIFYTSQYEPGKWAVMHRLTKRLIEAVYPDALS